MQALGKPQRGDIKEDVFPVKLLHALAHNGDAHPHFHDLILNTPGFIINLFFHAAHSYDL